MNTFYGARKYTNEIQERHVFLEVQEPNRTRVIQQPIFMNNYYAEWVEETNQTSKEISELGVVAYL